VVAAKSHGEFQTKHVETHIDAIIEYTEPTCNRITSTARVAIIEIEGVFAWPLTNKWIVDLQFKTLNEISLNEYRL
jgi:hypothetical protein